MRNIFNSIQLTRPKKNVFDLTHDVKMSGKMGILYPVMCVEAVPSDKFILGCDSLIRFAPMLAPIMHRVDVSIHYFFVPNRILWDNWEKFITGNEESTPVMPTIELDPGSITSSQKAFLDYFGIPPIPAAAEVNGMVNALPFAAYQKIYNDYYRDENLISEVDYKLSDGVNNIALFCNLRNRAWEHDYFTAALPFAQKGAAVDIPLGTVELNPAWAADGSDPRFSEAAGATLTGDIESQTGTPPKVIVTPSNTQVAYDPDGSLEVGSTTINDLRRAFKLQEWLERNARGGTRYVESILAHFGVKSPDKRLQRAEYITGVKAPVVISEVLNTTGPFEYDQAGTPVQTGSPQGDMSGHGVSVTSGKSGSYYCEEHGYIIGVLSVIPKTAYQDGIPKHFIKRDYLDYYFPSFAHLGEQPVQNQELYAYTSSFASTFGYVPRYAEYKYMPSRVAGDFRTSLDYWHLGRKFSAQPALNAQFVEVKPDDVSRIFAVTEGDNLWMHLLHRVKAIRPMPKFGSPTL